MWSSPAGILESRHETRLWRTRRCGDSSIDAIPNSVHERARLSQMLICCRGSSSKLNFMLAQLKSYPGVVEIEYCFSDLLVQRFRENIWFMPYFEGHRRCFSHSWSPILKEPNQFRFVRQRCLLLSILSPQNCCTLAPSRSTITWLSVFTCSWGRRK